MDIVTVLPSYYNRAELFKKYTEAVLEPRVKMSTFYKLFKSEFGPRRRDHNLPWIRISKYTTHGKCDVCLGLAQYLRTCKNPAEAEFCRGLIALHAEKYKCARYFFLQFSYLLIIPISPLYKNRCW